MLRPIFFKCAIHFLYNGWRNKKMDTQPWLGLRSHSPSANIWPLVSLRLLPSHCSVFISRRKPANKTILLASRRAWDSHIAGSQRHVATGQQPATFTAIPRDNSNWEHIGVRGQILIFTLPGFQLSGFQLLGSL